MGNLQGGIEPNSAVWTGDSVVDKRAAAELVVADLKILLLSL